MNDLISRRAAIKLAIDLDYESRGILKESKCREIENRYNMIPSAQSERWSISRGSSKRLMIHATAHTVTFMRG